MKTFLQFGFLLGAHRVKTNHACNPAVCTFQKLQGECESSFWDRLGKQRRLMVSKGNY